MVFRTNAFSLRPGNHRGMPEHRYIQTYLELNFENDQGVLRTTAAGRSRLNTIVDGLVA